jgi:hypothetical protein
MSFEAGYPTLVKKPAYCILNLNLRSTMRSYLLEALGIIQFFWLIGHLDPRSVRILFLESCLVNCKTVVLCGDITLPQLCGPTVYLIVYVRLQDYSGTCATYAKRREFNSMLSCFVTQSGSYVCLARVNLRPIGQLRCMTLARRRQLINKLESEVPRRIQYRISVFLEEFFV